MYTIFKSQYHRNCVTKNQSIANIFTARRYAIAVYAVALCPSVSVSITSRCFTKTPKHMDHTNKTTR